MMPLSPFDLMRMSLQTGIVMARAQSLLVLRLMAIAGAWPVAPQRPAPEPQGAGEKGRPRAVASRSRRPQGRAE